MPLRTLSYSGSHHQKLPHKSWSIPEEIFQALSKKPIGTTLRIQLSANEEPRAFRVITAGPNVVYKNTPQSGVQFGIVQIGVGKYSFAPLTEKGIQKPPLGKIFELIEMGEKEPLSEKTQTNNVGGGLKKWVWGLTTAAVVGGGALLHTAYKDYQDTQRILKHPSLINPIPNIPLYQYIKIPSGFPLSQISGEYNISLGQLYALNPQLKNKGAIENGRVKDEITLRVPKVKTLFQLTEPRTWNDIGKEYGVAPEVLIRINGNSVGIGDLIYIPTDTQVRDIEHYLFGHDIEEFPFELTAESTLEQIALAQQIPDELREMFYEMNLASPGDTSPGAIHDIHAPICKGGICKIPKIRTITLSTENTSRQKYDIHTVGESDTVQSILKYYGLTPEMFQKLNPHIPLNGSLKGITQVRTRDTTEVLATSHPLTKKGPELSDTIVRFVFKKETAFDFDKTEQWADKFGHFRPGLSAKKKTDKQVTVLGKDKKKKTATKTVEEYIFPNDGPTFDPGIDLGQMEEGYIRYAFETVLDEALLERVLEFARYTKNYRKEKVNGKTREHALKEIPPEFQDIADIHLKPEQTRIVSRRAMQCYWDNYVKRDIPRIDEPGFAPDEIKGALLSIYYHRGGYYLQKFPTILNLIRTGQWSNPELIAVIGTPKGSQSSMVERANSELHIYRMGVDDARLSDYEAELARWQRDGIEGQKLTPSEYALSKDVIHRYEQLRGKKYVFGKFDCQIFLRSLLDSVIGSAPELQIGVQGDPLGYNGMGEKIAAALSIVPSHGTLSKEWLAPYGSWPSMLERCHDHGKPNGLQYHIEVGFMQIKIDKNNTPEHTAQVLATFSHNLREGEVAIFAESGVYSEKTKDGKTRGFGHTGLIRQEGGKLSFYNAGLIDNGISTGLENGIMESGWEDLKTDLEAKIAKSDAVVLTFAKIRPDLILRAFPQNRQ